MSHFQGNYWNVTAQPWTMAPSGRKAVRSLALVGMISGPISGPFPRYADESAMKRKYLR